jgi:hypothetical protein
MNKLFLIAAVLSFITTLALGQDFSKEFGKVGQEEINLTKYSKDPSAEAVILFDIGDSRFVEADEEYNYNIEFTRAKRIKIFTKAAVEYAEVSIPFYIDEKGNAEKIKTIEAYSYNWENGQLNRTSLDPSTVYIEKINNRWSQKKFVIPNAKPGSIVEYRFVLESPFHFNLPDWKFQGHIPTVYSKYVVRMVPFYEYAFILQGTNRFDFQSTEKDPNQRVWGTLSKELVGEVGTGVRFQDLVSTYVLKDVPAFKDEEYITSDDDYLIKLDFQESKYHSPFGGVTEIISTWPKLIQELQKNDNFGKYMKACEKPAKKILETELVLEGKNDDEKCKAIINYVKAGFKWDEYRGIYSSKSQKEFINQKNGNSADINLFLTALLRAAGIDAYPVILSTRDHGRINSNYPFIHYFNYVAVLVNLNKQPFLCDGTEFYTNYNRIPARCINDKGLVIQEGDPKWVTLNQGYRSIDDKTVTMEISPETLKAKTRLVLQAVEFDSYWYKKTFLNDSMKLKKQLNEMGLSVINKITTLNFEKNEFPYVISCEGEADIEQLNDKLVISPFLGFFIKENKLKQPSRTYPIDFTYAKTESYNCKIKIPEGYRVLTMPEAFSLDNEIARIIVGYTVNDDIITINSEYGFKKAVNPPKDYDNIKNYFDIIIKKFNDQIVLAKK